MASPSNADRLRACYARWDETKGGDASDWLALLGEEFSLRSVAAGVPEAPFTADCNCPAEVQRYLDGLARDWQMEFIRMDRFVSEGNTVVAIGRAAFVNRHTRKRHETPKVDIWTFRDGKAVAFEEFYDSHGLIEASRP